MDTSNYSETENKRNEIKKEDKKALPKLIILMIISGFIGAAFAGVALKAMEYITQHSGAGLVELLHELQMSLGTYAGFATLAFALVLSVAGFLIYNHYKKIARHQDMNDETVHDRVEKGLNISMFNPFSYTPNVAIQNSSAICTRNFLFGVLDNDIICKKDFQPEILFLIPFSNSCSDPDPVLHRNHLQNPLCH